MRKTFRLREKDKAVSDLIYFRDALVRQGRAQMIIELGQEEELDDAIIIERLQKKVGSSLEKAKSYLAQYGKQLA